MIKPKMYEEKSEIFNYIGMNTTKQVFKDCKTAKLKN